MLPKLFIVCALVLYTDAAGYGSSGGSGGGYSSSSGSSGGGYGSSKSYGSMASSYGGGAAHTGSAMNQGPVQAAVRSRHTIEYIDVDLPQDEIAPQVVDVDAGVLPLVLNFKSASSRIQVHQTHEGARPDDIEETQSEDEPQLLRHTVSKPIVQELREIITPFRRVVQEIRPVEEEVKTIVSRGKGRRQNDYGDNTGSKSSYGTSGASRHSGGGGGGGYGGSSGSYGSSSFAGSRSKSY